MEIVLVGMAIDFRDKREVGALARIGKALREDLERLRHGPPPERWTDLLKRLNDEENRRAATSVRDNSRP